MKRLVVCVLVLTSIIQKVYAQKTLSGSREEYIIRVNPNVTSKSMAKGDDGYVDYYILREADSFIYMLSVTHININSISAETVYSNDYKESYLTECGCAVIDDRPVEYKGLLGREFEIRTELSGKPVSGYSVATVKSGILFNVNFFALDEKFALSKSNYLKMVNSLVFK